MKEMIGGCCVCSDEEGSSNNPIVYCDGKDCFVAVHKGCYGIDTIPDGSWYCRKCESPDRSARVRCDLCPIRDGALKRTKNGGWCHVLCALFIPEVDFENMFTMEPITLARLSPERLGKMCVICQENKQPELSMRGACITCNDSSCKIYFHASCAHIQGLLIEERGARSKLITYVGYCTRHFNKAISPENQKLRNIIARPLPAFQHPRSAKSEPSSTKTLQVPPIKLNLSKINDAGISKRQANPSSNKLNHSTPSVVSEKESVFTEVKPSIIDSISVSEDCKPLNIDSTNASDNRKESQPIPNQKSNLTGKKRRKRPLTYSAHNRKSNGTLSKKAALNSIIRKKSVESELPTTIRKKTHLPQSWKTYDKAAPFDDMETDALFSTNGSHEPHIHPPTRLRTLGDLDLVLPQSSDEASAKKKMKTMEELLDWQWDQGALLLMQQCQSSDIVTLLNSLHILRKENDGLEGKALKLLRKRDHLLYVNAQLKQILNDSSNNMTSASAEVTDDQNAPKSSTEIETKPAPVLNGLPTVQFFTHNASKS